MNRCDTWTIGPTITYGSAFVSWAARGSPSPSSGSGRQPARSAGSRVAQGGWLDRAYGRCGAVRPSSCSETAA